MPFSGSRLQPCRAATTVADASAAAAHSLNFKAHIDFKFVKDNIDMLASNCAVRKTSADPALVSQLYDAFTRLKQETDTIRAQRNENSAAMKVSCGMAYVMT
jgi:seryl-tRNA synthetase